MCPFVNASNFYRRRLVKPGWCMGMYIYSPGTFVIFAIVDRLAVVEPKSSALTWILCIARKSSKNIDILKMLLTQSITTIQDDYCYDSHWHLPLKTKTLNTSRK